MRQRVDGFGPVQDQKTDAAGASVDGVERSRRSDPSDTERGSSERPSDTERGSSERPSSRDSPVTVEQSRSSPAALPAAGMVLPRKMTTGNPHDPSIVRRLFSATAQERNRRCGSQATRYFGRCPSSKGGYAQFGPGYAAGAQQVYQGYQTEPFIEQKGVSRPLTIDDVVTKTGITLGVLSLVAVVSYFLVGSNLGVGDAVHHGRRVRRPGARAGCDIRPQAGQPGHRAELRRAGGPVPRRDLVGVRQRHRVGRQRRRVDHAGGPRHHRRVRRHARRLQDGRHPRHAEVHPDGRRRPVRRARADARQPGAGAVRRGRR